MKDYVIANGNEKEFLEVAKKLGYTEIVFIGKATIPKTSLKTSVSTRIFKSNPDKDRELIESKKADIIFDFEQEKRKDPTHFRNSGINHILAKLMKQKNVSYGLSFSQILNASTLEQSRLMGRISQNARLCKKYGVNVIVASFAKHPYEMRDSKDLEAFARVMGIIHKK